MKGKKGSWVGSMISISYTTRIYRDIGKTASCANARCADGIDEESCHWGKWLGLGGE